MDNYTVYMHLNLINLKKYIGMTGREPEERFGFNGIHYKDSPKFYNAIQKHGWNNFAHIILYNGLTKQGAEEIEKSLISFYSTNGIFGYNIANGGNSTGKHSEETRKKISMKRKGKKAGEYHQNYGKHLSELTRKKISQKNSGHIITREQREKLRIANLGKKLTDECKSKIKKALIKAKGKKVVQICKNSMCIVDEFCSMSEATEKTNVDHRKISDCCNGRRKSAGGYIWKYADINTEQFD